MKIKKLKNYTYLELFPAITLYTYPHLKKYSISFSWLKYGFIILF